MSHSATMLGGASIIHNRGYFMATFEINGGTNSQRKVEAEKYGINDGYFHFTTDAKGRVLSIAVERVASVERVND
ncbi:hypothetical protein ABIA70_000426 [Arthrobacter sp. 754]